MKKYWALTVAIASALASCSGEQSHWDGEVSRMCKQDGGVTILEQVRISQDEFNRMPKVGGYTSIPSRAALKSTDKVFWDESIKVLHAANPRVWRSEHLIKRRNDEKVVARVVTYSRVGGDAPSPAHSSQFVCPVMSEVFAQREKIFIVEGGH
jgi:hypothetical protein